MNIRKSRTALPSWILFYNLAGYDYYPEQRVSGIKKMSGVLRSVLEWSQPVCG